MEFPGITAFYSATLGLVFLGLSVRVVIGRARFRVSIGDGGQKDLGLRIRSHANFSEYVPLALILIALVEMKGYGGWIAHALGAVLLIARLAHPVGMAMPGTSPFQRPFRGLGTVGTWLVMAIAAGLLLVPV
ncbi:MAPEG family protein [Pseudogemmobacter sonorensis]|uniref:MAPEG family protein n=1 Tax=Pseudogemmobacter sonorensis TaxID=2989681 RepID=UPI00369ABD62